MKRILWIAIGVVACLCVTAIISDDVRYTVQAAASHLDRLVLGSGNYGTDPNTTADITLQNDEYITNATNGTVGFGSADLLTTGSLSSTDVTATSSLILGSQAHQEYTVKVTITTAEVLALNATPDTMIAAPGANKAIIFLDAIVLLDYNSTAYDGVAAGEDLIISYTDGSGEVVSEIETTGFLDQGNDELRYVTPSAGADGADNAYIIPVANKPLCLSLLTGEIATGNSPIDIVIHYKVVATDL